MKVYGTGVKSKEGRGGFTLVELLVVVAIISLLISILLPALNRAKEEARMVVCRTNLKSLGTAYAMYTADNNDWYPAAAGWGGDPPIWDQRLYGDNSFWAANGVGEKYGPKYFDSLDLLKCPSDKLDRSWWGSGYHPRSYAMNINVSYRGPSPCGIGLSNCQGVVNYEGEVPYTEHGSVYKTSDVEIPADTILLGEEWESWYYGDRPVASVYGSYRGHGIYDGMWSSSVPEDPPSRSPTFYHRDKAWCNFVFCDGHATPLRKDNPYLIDTDGDGRNDPGELYYYKRIKW